jgi:hypothetical protein
MSTVSRVQHVLGLIAQVRVNHSPVQMINPRVSAESAKPRVAAPQPTPAVTTGPTPATTWDPHEVWLNRVKRPRERRTG